AVLSAERWAVIADVLGARENPALTYPRDDLGRAWKQVLFNQFHDVLPGSAIESGYHDARDQLGEAVSISKRITVRAHNVIARQIDIPMIENTQPLVVFNPHPWPVTAPVEINYGGQPTGAHVRAADDTKINSQPVQPMSTTNDRSRGALLFDAELPALGYRLYRIHPGSYAATTELYVEAADDGRLIMSNRLLRVEIDPQTGWLSSLVDRRTGVELAGSGPHLQLCSDPTDTWGHRVVSYAWPGDDMPVDRIRVVESGPLRAAVRVERSWGRSRMTETFVLGSDSDALELRYAIDWCEPGHLLKIRFPVPVADPQATYEIPFATLQRPVDGAEEPAQSWVDLTGTVGSGRQQQQAGLVVINNAKHGYDVSPADSPVPDSDASIGITAVRSPVYAWHDPKELDPDGVYSYQSQGHQEFGCLLVPHGGNWRTVQPTRRAAELGLAPRAMLETFHDGPLPPTLTFAEVITTEGNGQVLATAIKGAEDAAADGRCDLIVRISETAGHPAAAEVRLPVVGRTIRCELTPYQIRTFRIPVEGRRRITEVNLLELDDKINNAEQPFRQGRS
ncbi:MAG TPA: glycoside hydrolase family 38 C-terminal domain-containing protein, partial [Microlunatus sp.]